MKRQLTTLLLFLLLLALSACGVSTPSPSPTPSPTATPEPSRLSSCSSTAAPDGIDTWSPPPEAAAITPLSCDEIGDVFTYDSQVPLDVQEVSRRREEGVTVIDLTYASPMGGRVPATIVLPDGAGPFAGMLYQHGMPGTRQPMIPTAVSYARMGAVVLLIDAPFARRANGLAVSITFTEQDRLEQIQLIVDLRRGVDLLLSRPEVDPERMVYVGGSYGGAMGGLLAGVEHRLKAYVLQVGDGGLVTHFTGSEYRAAWLARPEEQRRQWVAWMWPIEPIHYVGCASPAALLFQNGTLDTAVPPADGLRYQEAGNEPKTVCWYPAGHALDAAAVRDQAEWLSERIGISFERLVVPVDPQVLAAYAGKYQLPDGVILTIRVDGTRIFIQVPNQPEVELLARSENQFYPLVGAGELTFFKNAGDEVDRMAVVTGEGKTLEAKKVP